MGCAGARSRLRRGAGVHRSLQFAPCWGELSSGWSPPHDVMICTFWYNANVQIWSVLVWFCFGVSIPGEEKGEVA